MNLLMTVKATAQKPNKIHPKRHRFWWRTVEKRHTLSQIWHLCIFFVYFVYLSKMQLNDFTEWISHRFYIVLRSTTNPPQWFVCIARAWIIIIIVLLLSIGRFKIREHVFIKPAAVSRWLSLVTCQNCYICIFLNLWRCIKTFVKSNH